MWVNIFGILKIITGKPKAFLKKAAKIVRSIKYFLTFPAPTGSKFSVQFRE